MICQSLLVSLDGARWEGRSDRPGGAHGGGRAARGRAGRRHAGTRAANLARGEEGRSRALEKRHVDSARQLVRALGTMKGAAMKVGQMLSVIDAGLIPAEFRDEFQAELAKLRDAAPKVSFKQMKKVIESDLGERLGDVFSEFEEEPIAAASIGQVYRARLADDGREVAVKVQYPGVATAVRVDLQNLGIFMRAMKAIAPGLDTGAIADEIRERIAEELDYELEAQNQRSAARLYRGHPFIVVPDVITSVSSEHVLVTEYVDGTGFEQLKHAPDEERDRVAEIIFRFYVGGAYRHGQFSPDPHPGNFLLLADGRVAFLDFGLYKHMERDKIELELACQRAVAENDPEEVHRILNAGGFLIAPERVSPQQVFDFVYEAFWWWTTDEEIELTPEIATEVVFQTMDPRSEHFARARHQDMRPEHLFLKRTEMMVLAALGQLHVRGNWHSIAREWMYDEPPVTDLGRAEADFVRRATPA